MAVAIDKLGQMVMLSGISMYEYDLGHQLQKEYVAGAYTQSPTEGQKGNIEAYLQENREENPILWEDQSGVLLGLIPLRDRYYLTGPVLPADQIKLLTYLEVVFSILTGREIYQKDILIHQNVKIDENESRTQDILFDDQTQIVHHSFQDEMEVITAIEQGDKDTVHEFLEKGFIQSFRQSSPDMLTHYRNVAISSITLASRAAIRGGVPATMAYDFSNTMMKQVDHIPTVSQMYAWICSVFNKYTQMVIDEKETEIPNGVTEQCRQYVIAHYKQKITVQDIADYIGKSPNYISSLFKEKVGMSLTEYINLEKINAAKNILKYSDLDVSAVSNFLSFSSQAYFGKVFKDITGMTPKKYKDLNRVKELSFESAIK